MINLQLNIRNPWNFEFKNIRNWHGQTFFPNKSWEFEIVKTSDIVDLMINFTHNQDHAGLRLSAGLFGYGIQFQFYDNRHWHDETERWKDK